MDNTGKREEEKKVEEANQPKLPKKKRKTKPEVIIAPTRPGGPDISIE